MKSVIVHSFLQLKSGLDDSNLLLWLVFRNAWLQAVVILSKDWWISENEKWAKYVIDR